MANIEINNVKYKTRSVSKLSSVAGAAKIDQVGDTYFQVSTSPYTGDVEIWCSVLQGTNRYIGLCYTNNPNQKMPLNGDIVDKALIVETCPQKKDKFEDKKNPGTFIEVREGFKFFIELK
jgi:hypothetical protein